MKDSTLLKNTLWYGIIPKLAAIINMLLLPITTPYLTRADYGIIGIINSYTGLFIALSSLGLHMHLPNSYFELKTKYKLVWRRIFALILLSSVIFAFIQILCLFLTLDDTSPYSRIGVILLSVVPILFYSNQLIANNYYVLIEKPKPLVTRNLIAGLCGIFITAICIVVFRLGYLSWLISSTITSVLLFVFYFKPIYSQAKIYPYLPNFKSRIQNYILIALPVLPHSAGHIILSSSDRIIMSLYKIDISDIGLYTNGYQMGEYVSFVIVGIFTALGPTLQRCFRSDDFKKMQYYFKLTQMCVFVLIILSSLWMHTIYEIFIRNESLQPACSIAIVVVFSFMYFPLYTYMSLPVFVKKKTHHILWLIFAPAILNIILNIIAIPHFGYKSVVYVTLISYWTVPLIIFIHPFYKNEMKLVLGNKYQKTIILNMLLWIASFFILTMYVQKLAVLFLIIISIFIVLLAFLYYKYIQRDATLIKD